MKKLGKGNKAKNIQVKKLSVTVFEPREVPLALRSGGSGYGA